MLEFRHRLRKYSIFPKIFVNYNVFPITSFNKLSENFACNKGIFLSFVELIENNNSADWPLSVKE